MRSASSLIILSMLTMLACPSVGADDHYVDLRTGKDGADGSVRAPLGSIRAALERAAPGDTIHLADGFYNETIRPTKSGNPDAPVRIVGNGEDVWVSPIIEVDDDKLAVRDAPTGVYSIDVTVPPKTILVQRFFKPILVNDENWSRFVMNQADGPVTLVRVRDDDELRKVEGSYRQEGEDLWIHVFPHAGIRPGKETTDLKIVSGEAVRIEPEIEHVTIENIRTMGTVRIRGKHCVLRGVHAGPESIWLEGEENLIEHCRIAHAIFRTVDQGYAWHDSSTGHALLLWGRNNVARRCEILHSWNGIASNSSIGAVADGLVIRGMPNHSWQPGYSRDLTIRNCVLYNAQDALYFNSSRNVRIENCTLFAGSLIQEVPKEHEYGKRAAQRGQNVLGGPYVFRNNLILGYAWQVTGGWGVNEDSTWEKGSVFENNVIIPRRPGQEIQHTEGKTKRWMTLEAYAAEAAKHPDGNWATVRNNIVLKSREDFERILQGGAWKPETDEWDIRITDGKSPAVDAGTAVDFAEDAAGKPRQAGAAVDIGALEHQPLE